ncbi:hypothetical protein BGY98DRAFT_278112 [Russula aff. rugulosa BPL654]|nr:hypothetical protein BGY98DRAFT_278112 [Russula aff. rugulosa BPL654]
MERVDGPPRREQRCDSCIHLLRRFLRLISESCPPRSTTTSSSASGEQENCRPRILQPQVHALNASDFSRSMGKATRYLSRSRANIRCSCTTVVAVTTSDSNEAPGRGIDTLIDSDKINGWVRHSGSKSDRYSNVLQRARPTAAAAQSSG